MLSYNQLKSVGRHSSVWPEDRGGGSREVGCYERVVSDG